MKPRDLVPLKVVAEDLCVSRTTLWRARLSNLPDFPSPTIIRRQVYWKKTELAALEDALMRYRGRCAFEEAREAERKSRTLRRAKALKKKPARAVAKPNADQPDLFKC